MYAARISEKLCFMSTTVLKEIILIKLIFQKLRIFGAFSYVKIRILGNARRIIEIQNRLILFGYILENIMVK